jgi:hypothetical protein
MLPNKPRGVPRVNVVQLSFAMIGSGLPLVRAHGPGRTLPRSNLCSRRLNLVFDLDQSRRGKVSKTVNFLNLIDQKADYGNGSLII